MSDELKGFYISPSGESIAFGAVINEYENNDEVFELTSKTIDLNNLNTTLKELKLRKPHFGTKIETGKGEVNLVGFSVTADEYTNFCNNVLDKELNWKVKNRIGGEVTIPGIWYKTPITTNPHTNANTIPTRTPKANKLKKRRKTYKTSLSTILEDEEGKEGGKRRKTKKRKQRKSNKRRK